MSILSNKLPHCPPNWRASLTFSRSPRIGGFRAIPGYQLRHRYRAQTDTRGSNSDYILLELLVADKHLFIYFHFFCYINNNQAMFALDINLNYSEIV